MGSTQLNHHFHSHIDALPLIDSNHGTSRTPALLLLHSGVLGASCTYFHPVNSHYYAAWPDSSAQFTFNACADQCESGQDRVVGEGLVGWICGLLRLYGGKLLVLGVEWTVELSVHRLGRQAGSHYFGSACLLAYWIAVCCHFHCLIRLKLMK